MTFFLFVILEILRPYFYLKEVLGLICVPVQFEPNKILHIVIFFFEILTFLF